MKMLRKLAVAGGALCATALMVVAPASAGVVGSRHDVTSTHAGNVWRTDFASLAEFGTCSACHIPHGAGADKLFPSAGTGGVGGQFGSLCGSCHDSGAFASGDNNIWINNSVFDTNAHGLSVVDLGTITDDDVTASGLNYTTGDIECLSCHDVHNQANNRPFLALPLYGLCQACHDNRVNNDTATSGFANTGSTHPSGPVYTGDMGSASGVAKTAASSPIVAWAGITNSNVDVTTDYAGSSWADAAWTSGSHLEGTAVEDALAVGTGVGCVTCHTVHWGNNVNGGNTSEFLGFVAGGTDETVANNAFCEACHRGGPGGVATPGVNGYYWNPGGTAYSHPNDDNESTALARADVPGFPLTTATPISALEGAGTSDLVCTSCHGVHPSYASGAETEPNTPILLPYVAGAVDICGSCHTAGTGLPFLHHPTGAGVYDTIGNTAGNVTCSGGDTGTGVGTCHGGATGAGVAHNRTTPLGAGLDTNYSQMCMNCHTNNPSTYTDTTPYTAQGAASHFIGDAAVDFTGTRTTGMAAGDPTTGAIRWAGDQSTWDGSTLTSKMGANNTTLICESCHRLARNNIQSGDGNTVMLVEVAGAANDCDTADNTLAVSDYTDAPYICTGCHLVPSGTHPLAEANEGAYTITNGQGQAYAANGLNCESCHSAHDADTSSGSYILDSTAAANGVNAFGSNANGMAIEPTINYTNFCAVCHPSFR